MALPAESGNVRSMKDFLRETLAEIEAVDARLHAGRDFLRERLTALELAEDDAFLANVDTLAERVAAGNAPAPVSLDNLSSRFTH